MTGAPIATRCLLHPERPIFEQGSPGRSGASLPAAGVDALDESQVWPAELRRAQPAGLPELSEVEVTRHFTRLSRWNYAIDIGLYPLGSCTMKYNPKVNELLARLPGLAQLHPYQPAEQIQGALRLLWELERLLCEIGGFAAASLQPAAGAHGELCGLMLIRAFHTDQGRRPRRVLVPDSAHGTNPASCALNGFQVVPVATGPRGYLEVDAVRAACVAGDTAAIMVTNPNTVGLFEEKIAEIAEVMHAAGGLVYMDGANLNALLGKVRPGDTGVDVMHFNLHKTFSTPHGGGGPGAGPVGVTAALVPFLPLPVVRRDGGRASDAGAGSAAGAGAGDDQAAGFRLDYDCPKSIGRVRSFLGNFAMLVRAYAYIRELGAAGLTRASEMAVLNANYLRVRLAEALPAAHDRPCMHEVVLSDKRLKKETGVMTLDVAKRLMDHGFHPPTVYFPLIVPGAMMIEPTESESRDTLDEFAEALLAIVEEARREPQTVKSAPHLTGLRRLDETAAARKPRLRWRPAAPA